MAYNITQTDQDTRHSSWSTRTARSANHATYSSLPEVHEHYVGKEVTRSDEKEIVESFAFGLPTTHCGNQVREHVVNDWSTHQSFGSRGGVSRFLRRASAIITTLVCVGVAVGVGLGLGLRRNRDPPAATSPISKPNPSHLSKRGAYNGTGIWAVQQQSLWNLTSASSTPGRADDGKFLLVLQHHSGSLRWMQRAYPDNWHGGTAYDVLATDAKNATPIALRSSGLSGVASHHVFYISQDNMLRQRFIDNLTYTWNDGPLNSLNIEVLNASKVGLAACFYQGPIDDVDLNGTDPLSGMRLWVATNETTFVQYAWRAGLPQWQREQAWYDMNGHATPGCYGWASGSATYVMFVDNQNTTRLYWNDASLDVPGNATHPVNSWVKSSIQLPKVDPYTGLNFHGDLYGRPLNSNLIHGWNITFDAESSSLTSTTLSVVDGDPPIANTNLYAFTTPAVGDLQEGIIFYQTEGDDITMFTGDVDTGMWTSTRIPIPDD